MSFEKISADRAIENLRHAFYSQNDELCPELTQTALAAGVDPQELIEKHLILWVLDLTSRCIYTEINDANTFPGLKHSVSLSDLMMAIECLQACSWVLNSASKKSTNNAKGKIVIGTIEGDVHEFGRKIIALILSTAGYQVTDLGFDVPPREFNLKAKEKKANIIAISCSVKKSKNHLKSIVKTCVKEGIRDNVMIMVGGGATNSEDAETFGVDAYGIKLQDVLKKTNELMQALETKKPKN